MKLVKVIETEIDSLKRRVVKLLGMGRNDVRTALEANAFGVDGNPIKNMIAIYSPTSLDGKQVILGYLNRNQLAGIGELRTYSTDEAGVEKFYTWLKNNGTYEIGGTTDNAVRYTPLDAGLQNQITALNTELTKIQAAIVGLGGSYAMIPVSLNISASKIDEIKTL